MGSSVNPSVVEGLTERLRERRPGGPHMRLEDWLVELIATADAGLRLLRAADSDADYRRIAEAVADQLEFFCRDHLIAHC